MEFKTISQNWQYSKKYPDGKPIFFVDGRRVSIEKGLEIIKEKLITAPQVEEWFIANGYDL
jgi:hypothetical protein